MQTEFCQNDPASKVPIRHAWRQFSPQKGAFTIMQPHFPISPFPNRCCTRSTPRSTEPFATKKHLVNESIYSKHDFQFGIQFSLESTNILGRWCCNFLDFCSIYFNGETCKESRRRACARLVCIQRLKRIASFDLCFLFLKKRFQRDLDTCLFAFLPSHSSGDSTNDFWKTA